MTWQYIAGYFDGEGTVSAVPIVSGANRCTLVWYNNHYESLKAMQEFMGLGRIIARKPPRNPNHQQQYYLIISKRSEMLSVIPYLKEHCIIKLPKVLELEKILEGMRDQSTGWGNLAIAGKEEITRLYWEEKLGMKDIGEKYSVSRDAVKVYMNRHGIPKRSRKEAMALAHWDSPKMKARNEQIRQRRLKDWQDPEYRKRQISSLRGELDVQH